MKFTIVLLVALTGAGAYLYLNPDVWHPWVRGTPLEPAPTKTQLYKWLDENGQWQRVISRTRFWNIVVIRILFHRYPWMIERWMIK